MSALRWIAVLPVAVLAPIVAITFLRLMMFLVGLIDWRWDFSTQSVFGVTVEYALFAWIFVVAGVFTAPAGKRIVAVLFALVFYLYLSFQVFVILFYLDSIVSWLPVLNGVSGVVGASVALWAVFKDEDLSFLSRLSQ